MDDELAAVYSTLICLLIFGILLGMKDEHGFIFLATALVIIGLFRRRQ